MRRGGRGYRVWARWRGCRGLFYGGGRGGEEGLGCSFLFVGLGVGMLISGEEVILIVVKRFLSRIKRCFLRKVFKKVLQSLIPFPLCESSAILLLTLTVHLLFHKSYSASSLLKMAHTLPPSYLLLLQQPPPPPPIPTHYCPPPHSSTHSKSTKTGAGGGPLPSFLTISG